MATSMEGSSIGQDSIEMRKCVEILILGDYDVGKTTLIKTYLGVDDIPGDDFAIFKENRIRVRHKEKSVDFSLIDLRSRSLAPERRASYPSGVNAILLCFSIGRYESLKSVRNLWIHEARAQYGESIPIFLVGLKRDVRFIDGPIVPRFSSGIPNDRIVEQSEAENVHEAYRFYGKYMECSKHDKSSVVKVICKAFRAGLKN